MPDKYFRVRRYLRDLGETNLDNFRVLYDNSNFKISEWHYTDREKPTDEQLALILQADVDAELAETQKIPYISDVYKFLKKTDIDFTVVRDNSVSILIGRRIQFLKSGCYKIFISGYCITADGEMVLAHNSADAVPFVIHKEGMSTANYYSFVIIVQTRALYDSISFVFKIKPGSSANITGNILIEYCL
jgi:hypothetical protein